MQPSSHHQAAIARAHDLAALLTALHTQRQGLSQTDAATRLARCGRNQLPLHRRHSHVLMLAKEFVALFPLLLLAASLLAFIAHALHPHDGFDLIGWALLIVVVLNALVSFAQNYKVEKVMRGFQQYITRQVNVWRDGTAQKVDADLIVPGDVVLIQAGDKIAADGIMLDGDEVVVDESVLTGESMPVEKLACVDSIAEAHRLYSGTTMLRGQASLLVTATGLNSRIGEVAELSQRVRRDLTPMQKELHDFVKKITLFSLFVGLLFFLIGFSIGNTFFTNLVFAIGIIVANVPEGLLPTVTLALTQASVRMAKYNAVIKDIRSVETLGSTTVICTDKTGTLTRNQLQVEKMYIDFGDVDIAENVHRPTLERAQQIMALCNSAVMTRDTSGQKSFSGDPVDVAMADWVQRLAGYDTLRSQFKILHVNSFDAHTRVMSVICETSGGVRLLMLKGAAETVIQHCNQVYSEGFVRPFRQEEKNKLFTQASDYAGNGLRVMALAYCVSEDFKTEPDNLVFTGLVAMTDPPRAEVPAAVMACKTAGIRIVVMSGDKAETVAYVTRQLGIAEAPHVVEGDQLAIMSHDELTALLRTRDVAFARIAPEQKLAIVEAFKSMGEIVAMTGDGVNDAPALKRADIGVAMGRKGTDVAREAADIILLDDNFATIVKAVEQGRAVYDNIRKFIHYVLASNVPEIMPYIAYVLLPIPLPITVIQILSIDLITDILPAIGLGNEAAETDVMQRPPRPSSERMVNMKIFMRSYGFIGVLEAVLAFGVFFLLLHASGWNYGDRLENNPLLAAQASAAFLATIIFCQIGNVMASRSNRQSALPYMTKLNAWILAGILFEIIFIFVIVYMPSAQTVFATQVFAPQYWGLMLLAAAVIFMADEGRKYLVRKGVTILDA
jgi:sodium/potassium-transporting ATPase subunit alpha